MYCIHSLLEIGADVNWKNHDGDTCLLTATRRGHLSTVQLLLLHNANINDVDKNGWNALHICCSKGDINILTLLLDANVNIHTRTNDGLTGYDIAQRHNQLHICNRLENHQQFLLSQNEIIQHSPTNLNSNRTNNNKTRNENILNKNKIVNDIQYPVNIENKNTTQPLSLIYENQSPNERKTVPQNLMEVYLEDKYEIQSMQNQVNSTQNLEKVESMPHNNTLNNHIMTNSMQNIHDEDSCPFIRLYENERKDKKAFQLRVRLCFCMFTWLVVYIDGYMVTCEHL